METGLTIKELEPIKERFVKICNEETYLKEASFALQHLAKNNFLAGCTRSSIQMAVLNIAQIGLTLNPALKLAYLVPRMQGGERICCLEPSYMGLCKLVTDTGSAKNIYAHLIYENDLFEQILGTENKIIHKPKLGERGEFVGVYAVAVLSDGRTQVEVMDKLDVYEIRDKSESYKAFKEKKVKTCVWEDSFGEMTRKTVIKRLTKYLPKTEHWDKISQAIELDNKDYESQHWQLDKIEELLKISGCAEEKKDWISKTMYSYNYEQASQTIKELESAVPDAILAGRNYSQTTVTGHLKNNL